jgi:3-oxoacyl-[acyl-carrier-protein] synthase II
MTISVRGIGWLTKEGYGGVRNGLLRRYETGEGFPALPGKDIFSHPFKNFGRLDAISKMTAYAVGLALRDAGVEYSPQLKQDIGIVGTNAEGSLRSDIEYFRDYVAAGRTLSRGNLFIYTLPSSPVGEAAIHFGLQGPLLYAADERNALAGVLDTASEMLLADEAPLMLAGKAEAAEALFFLLEKGGMDKPVLCDLAEARSAVETITEVAGLVRKFLQFTEGKG